MQHTTTTLPVEMSDWVAAATGRPFRGATRIPGGGRKEGWLVTLGDAEGDESRLFLRWDRADPRSTGDPWTVHRESEVYRALDGRGLRVAGFVAAHPTEQAMLLEAVRGDGRFGAIADGARATAIARDFMRCLADIHRLDPVDLGLADPGATLPDHVHAQLDELDFLIRFRGGTPAAELGVALRWLRDNVPDHRGRVVLVQGDTGPGNFMFHGDRVVAIVDWELAHPGDPMDDLAWVSLRSAQDPFPELAERFREYELMSGAPVDLDRICYYRVLAEAKIAVMGHGADRGGQRDDGSGGGDVGARLIFGQLHRRLLVEALADVMGVDVDAADAVTQDDGENQPWHGLYGMLLTQLREVITPRISDGFALQRTKGLVRALKYLAAVDRNGRRYAGAEFDELAALLGVYPTSVEDGRQRLAEAVRNGVIDARAVLEVVWRRVARDDDLLREASGSLADRHYDPLAEFHRAAR